jgi:hypothetical protein
MTTFRRLVQFEYSRFSSLVPGFSRKGIQSALIYMVILIAGAMYVFRHYDSPEVVFALGVAISWGLTLSIALGQIMTTWGQPQREWWLSFPYPRLTLVKSKAIALLRLGVSFMLLILLACMIYYGIATASGMMNPLPAWQLLSLAGSSLLLAGVMIPVAVILGLALSTMYSGWARWLLIPYLLFMGSPYILFGILMSLKESEFRFLAAPHLFLYALGFVVIGWPLSYVLMRLIAGIGMRNMADTRLRVKSTASYGKVKDTKVVKGRVAGKKSRFATLYAMERSRYRYFAAIPAVRIIMYTLLAIIVVGAYFSSDYITAMLEMLQVLFMLPVLAASIYTMNRSSIDRKNLEWWLGYPISRRYLLLAQLAGVGVTVMKMIGALSVAFWVGITAGLITGKMEWQEVSLCMEWYAYALIVYTTILTVSSGVLQSSYYFMKSTVLSIFLIPLFLIVSLQAIIINEFLYPDSFDSMLTPAWSLLGIIIAVGLALAAIGLYLGAKFVHQSLGNQKKIKD